MKTTRTISRRSFLGTIGGGAAAVGAVLTLSGCATLGYSDSDPYDPIGGGGYGRRGRRGGDDDGGGRGGRGHGGRGGRGGGCTDNDSGRNADPAGRGRC